MNAIRLSHSPATTAMIPRDKIRYIINGISLEENEKRLGRRADEYPLSALDSGGLHRFDHRDDQP